MKTLWIVHLWLVYFSVRVLYFNNFFFKVGGGEESSSPFSFYLSLWKWQWLLRQNFPHLALTYRVSSACQDHIILVFLGLLEKLSTRSFYCSYSSGSISYIKKYNAVFRNYFVETSTWQNLNSFVRIFVLERPSVHVKSGDFTGLSVCMCVCTHTHSHSPSLISPTPISN